VVDHHRLFATASPDFAAGLPKLVGTNRGWFGADLAITPVTYGTDIALLARALRRYLEDPAARAELRPPPSLA
jgi:hypothetical protein